MVVWIALVGALAAQGAAPPPKKTSILIMPLQAKGGVAPDLADQVTAVVTHLVGQREGVATVAYSEVQTAMSQEQMRQLTDCQAASCAAEIAGALNTDEVLIGNLGLVGDEYLLSLSRIRARDAGTSGRALERVPSKPATLLLDRIPFAVDQLFGVQGVADAPAPAAPVVVEEKGASALPMVLRGAGAAGVVGAVVPFLLAAGGVALYVVMVSLDGGPTMPLDPPRTHRINLLMAMAGQAAGITAIPLSLLGLAGVAISAALLFAGFVVS